jgi:hypothetical protein
VLLSASLYKDGAFCAVERPCDIEVAVVITAVGDPPTVTTIVPGSPAQSTPPTDSELSGKSSLINGVD